jgi:periplasmic copper chaperone A
MIDASSQKRETLVMTSLRLLVVTAFLATAALPLRAEDTGVTVENAWARASGAASAAYLTLRSERPDRLVGVASPVAGAASLHSSVNDGGIMRMRPAESIPVEPGHPTTLEPGGLHIMLEKLKHPLKEGDHFPLTLTFEKAGTREVEVRVEKAGARGPTNHGGMKPHSQMSH